MGNAPLVLRLPVACLAFAACAGPQGAGPAAPVERAPVVQESFFCRYEKNPFTLADGTLALTADGPAFARVKGARSVGVTLTVPWGSPALPLGAKFTSGWVTFRAKYRPHRGFGVYPLKPVPFGVLTLGGWAHLDFLGTPDGERMLAAAEPPVGYRPASPLRAALRCEDTTIVARGVDLVDESDELPDGGVPPKVELPREADVPVSPAPGGPADGVLRFEKPSGAFDLGRPILADELERRGDAVRVRKSLWPGVVTGWVPASAVKPFAPPDGGVSSVFGLGGLVGNSLGEGGGKPAWPRCGTGVELFVARGGALERVGEIHSNAAVVEKVASARWTTVELPELKWIELESGAEWALASGGLELCRSKAAPKK